MFGMGMPEILMILAIALVVIGPRKLPDLGRGLGKAMREFRKATSEFKSSLDIEDDLSDVRRSFKEMNTDLKSTLSDAAFGDKPEPRPQPEGDASSKTPPPASDAEGTTDRTSDTGAPQQAGAGRSDPPDQEDGDARS
jgi:TatA/E family protein of Tat protein translocase